MGVDWPDARRQQMRAILAATAEVASWSAHLLIAALGVVLAAGPHPLHIEEASIGILLGHLTAVYRLVEERQHLRAKKRRGQHMMPVGNHGLVAS